MGDNYGFVAVARRSEKRKLPQDDETDTRSKKKITPKKTPNPPTSTLHKYAVTTSNRFGTFSQDESDDENTEGDSDMETDNNSNVAGTSALQGNNNTQKTNKKHQPKTNTEKPKTIVLHGRITQHEEFKKTLLELAPSGFYIKYTGKTTQVHIETEEERSNVLNHLQSKKINGHSYTKKSAKTHAFVIKGLDTTPNPEELEDELKTTYKITPIKIYALKKVKRPLYMVVTDSTITLKQLEKIRILNYTAIRWERQLNNKKIIQCHRCQTWGHATSNCWAEERCMKCAENHWTYKCTKPETEAAKCANCDGNHPANSDKCEVYIDRLQYLEGQRETQKSRSHHQRDQQRPGPDMNNSQQFPRLKRQTDTRRNPWTQPSQNNVTTHNTNSTNVLTPNQDTITNNVIETREKFNTLNNVISELNSLINLDATIKAITELNELLKKCSNDKMQKLQTMKAFIENIDQYDI